MDTAYIDSMSMPTRGKNGTGILPFQVDLQLLEELYPVLIQNSEPVFLRGNNQTIDTKFNGRNYIFIDDDFMGGCDAINLPEGEKIGYKAVFQNDRENTVIVQVPEHVVISTEEKWITIEEYEENKSNYNFINYNLSNTFVLVNPLYLIEEEKEEIPTLEMREARWNGKTWVFRKPLIKRTVIIEENPFEIRTEENFIKIVQDFQNIFIRAPRTWDYFQFLNQTETTATVNLQLLENGLATEDWKENGSYETVTIDPNCMVYVYWNGIEWKKAFGFEDERIMRDRIQSLEDRIKNGEIDVLTHLPQSNNKNIANTEYVDKAISYFMHPVGSEYAQLDITGEGFEKRSPAMLFNSDRGNGTDSGTTWELLFTEGVYFKTEGGDNEDENPLRVNGIQPDGIRDFSWIQTQTAIDHTHTLTAEKENQIDVSGNTSGTNDNHYHTLEEALDGSTGSDSHNHSGSISMSPSQAVTSAPSTGSRGVGPVIEPTNGEWVYGNWEYGFPGSPPPDTNEWDYEVDTPGGGGYWDSNWNDWEDYGTFPSVPANTYNPPVEYRKKENKPEVYGDWEPNGYSDWQVYVHFPVGNELGTVFGVQIVKFSDSDKLEYKAYSIISGEERPEGEVWNIEGGFIVRYRGKGYYPLGGVNAVTNPVPVPTDPDTEDYKTDDVWYTLIDGTKHKSSMQVLLKRTKSVIGYKVERRTKNWISDTGGTYKRRTKTWVPGNNGSGSLNAVSSVNTSFISFTVNTSGVSLGGDGSHSHTISIPTSGSSNENGHTHTVSASGTADINVSGRTESGGAHSHTFDFKTNRDLYLLDLFGNLTTAKVPIAGETTVKNRKMRIWRRTA